MRKKLKPSEALEDLLELATEGCIRSDPPYIDSLREVIRSDWAMRVLDAWEDSADYGDRSVVFRQSDITWIATLTSTGYANRRVTAPISRDAARLAAAEAVFPELPASVRDELGPKP